jgi:hypothetical protein
MTKSIESTGKHRAPPAANPLMLTALCLALMMLATFTIFIIR